MRFLPPPIAPIDLAQDAREAIEKRRDTLVDLVDAIERSHEGIYLLGRKWGFFRSHLITAKLDGEQLVLVERSPTKDDLGSIDIFAHMATMGRYRQDDGAHERYNERVSAAQRENANISHRILEEFPLYESIPTNCESVGARLITKTENEWGDPRFWLKVAAYRMGADAIAEYRDDPARGIPIRQVHKE